ncbi:hypothetical protein BDN67DRAFT_964107 [Paxillus ammoniavirescens]|nr:hypothetical protein BDN67DRAFT_964107 [Paxillus ammoniavirescens]
MALNDRELTLGGPKGTDVHPGVANPTSHSTHTDAPVSNYVTNSGEENKGAGTGPSEGGKDARRAAAGVVEARPGIIESTHIDPLSVASNKDDGWANVPGGAGTSTNQPVSECTSGDIASDSVKGRLFDMVGGVANVAYGVATGDKGTTETGKQTLGLGRGQK